MKLSMKTIKKEESILNYIKCIFSIISIIISILIIANCMQKIDYIFQPEETSVDVMEHCKIVKIINNTSLTNTNNMYPYIAEVKYDNGDTGYIALDEYDFMTRKIGSDATVVNREYLQKIKGKI